MTKEDKGFYFGYSFGEVFGLTAWIFYVPEDKDLQIGFIFGWIMAAVGYTF